MDHRVSVIGSWLTLTVKALDSYGIDGKAFVKQQVEAFRLDALDLQLITDPDYRIPVSQTAKLWQAAVEATGDEAFGLKAGSYVHPTTFHALGLVMLSSGSLKELFEYWCRYLTMYSAAGYSELLDNGEHYVFTGGAVKAPNGVPYADNSAVEATLGALITLCRSHYGEHFSPVLIKMTRSLPQKPEAYEAFFDCPVEYSADSNYMYMDKAQLDEPIPRANPLLAHEMEKLVHDYLARMDSRDLIGRIHAVLFDLLPKGEVDQESVARAVHMSVRTVHRKLLEKGTSYRELLDNLRHELALKYIKQSNLPLIDISFLLGFSSSSNFARSFKRWEQKSPLQYRQSVMGLS